MEFNDLDSLKDQLKKIIISISPSNQPDLVDVLSDDEPLIDPKGILQLDSLDALELSHEIEEKFGVKFSGIGVARLALQSINSLADFLKNKKLDSVIPSSIQTDQSSDTPYFLAKKSRDPSGQNGVRIRISAASLISSLGNDLPLAASDILRGMSGLKKYYVKSARVEREYVLGLVGNTLDKDQSLYEECLYQPVAKVIADAGYTIETLANCGLFVGTTVGPLAKSEGAFMRNEEDMVPDLCSRSLGECTSQIAHRFRIRGPYSTYSSACTSSAVALLQAQRALRAGLCERAIVIGFDLASRMTILGFDSLLLYEHGELRPFDAARNGLQIGEASAAMFLEKIPQDFGAVEFELSGIFAYNDIRHETAASAHSGAMSHVISKCLRVAGLKPEEIIAIKAHGTGTRDNDAAEVLAMRQVFGKRLPPFFSLKPYIGHCLGAAGIAEMALLMQCIHDGFVPASLGFVNQDYELGAEPLLKKFPTADGTYLLNFFGFGGSNVSIALKHG